MIMKVLWMSDGPTIPSGYGNVTQRVCGSLADRGHHISILSWQAKGKPIPWQNCMVYSKLHPMYSPNACRAELLDYVRQLQPNIVVLLTDMWWLPDMNCPDIANFMHTVGIPWVFYYPVDGDTGEKRLPPNWVRILKTFDLPIAISRYGREVMQANGVESAYIPHGVDTKVFQPPADKDVAKRSLGYEGKFVVLSDARNQLRKMLPRTLEIFRRFAVNKDDVILHLHCDPNDIQTRSPECHYDLQSDIAFLNLTEKVSLTKGMSSSKGISLEQLAHIYQAADVHLLSSWGEGFGLPTLQAAASGVVPLALDYTASQELVMGHGEAIRARQCLLDRFGLRRGLIDIDETVSKLEMLYHDRQLLASKAQMAREFALPYDWEHLLPQWEELLQREVSRKRTTPSSVSLPDHHVEEDAPDLADTELETNAFGSHTTFKDGDPNALQDELETDSSENVTQPTYNIRIPVTLPLVKSKQRIPGYIYVASQCDVPSALALRRIFPGLKVWSTMSLDFGSSVSTDRPFQVKVVEANSPEYRPQLALSTLALDTGSFDPRLPIEAAKLGVPCIGLAQQREQAKLWPDLSLAQPDPMMAAELGRQMLTDQGVSTDLCLNARQALANTLIPVNEGSGSLRK
jgi:glycosyltransferase involved in cell wall biosynthesis